MSKPRKCMITRFVYLLPLLYSRFLSTNNTFDEIGTTHMTIVFMDYIGTTDVKKEQNVIPGFFWLV